MLRYLLGTGLLLATVNFLSRPAIAETVVECTYVGARRPAVRPTPVALEPVSSAPQVALDGMLGMSVIYPGIVVLMTMAAYYFLRVLEPQTVHDHPRFVRTAVVMSGLWLVGFFPFLSSAYGGFMFCVTAMSCTGAWFLMRAFGQQLKFMERMVVFWAFFFFSLFLAVLVTGRGAEVALLFNQPIVQLLALTGEIARKMGPLLLFAVNAYVALRVFRMMGVKITRPGDPETIKRMKVVALAAGMVILDIVMMETNFVAVTLLPLLLWAMPAFAYYGVYRFVSGMPERISRRASPFLFASLAAFLTVLVCIAAGATLPAMVLSALVLGLLASSGYGLPLLWKSAQHVAVKAVVTAAVAAGFFCGTWLVFACAQLSPDLLALYMGEVLLPHLLGWKTAVVLLPVCSYAAYAVLSSNYAPRAKYVLATSTILLLLMAYVGAGMVAPVLTGGNEPWVPADIVKAEAETAAPVHELDDGMPMLECKKVKK